jgi:hypothetical protein
MFPCQRGARLRSDWHPDNEKDGNLAAKQRPFEESGKFLVAMNARTNANNLRLKTIGNEGMPSRLPARA